jgi:hypothetical protein
MTPLSVRQNPASLRLSYSVAPKTPKTSTFESRGLESAKTSCHIVVGRMVEIDLLSLYASTNPRRHVKAHPGREPE